MNPQQQPARVPRLCLQCLRCGQPCNANGAGHDCKPPAQEAGVAQVEASRPIRFREFL